MDNIYLHHDDQQIGPFNEAKVRRYLEEGRIQPTTLAMIEGDTEWRTVADILKKPSPKPKQNDIIKKFELFNKYTNVRIILDSLADGGTVRNVFGRAVQIYAIIAGLLLLYVWYEVFAMLNVLTFTQGITLLIWQIFFPIAAFICLKAIFLRGSDIVRLPNSEFVIAPIMAIFITLHGEVAFIFLAIMSMPVALLVWFSASFMFPIDIDDGFFGGLYAFIVCWVVGFSIYCITRFIREWTMAIFSIANNIDLIRRTKTEI
jgi:hypothetical protein